MTKSRLACDCAQVRLRLCIPGLLSRSQLSLTGVFKAEDLVSMGFASHDIQVMGGTGEVTEAATRFML